MRCIAVSLTIQIWFLVYAEITSLLLLPENVIMISSVSYIIGQLCSFYYQICFFLRNICVVFKW